MLSIDSRLISMLLLAYLVIYYYIITLCVYIISNSAFTQTNIDINDTHTMVS